MSKQSDRAKEAKKVEVASPPEEDQGSLAMSHEAETEKLVEEIMGEGKVVTITVDSAAAWEPASSLRTLHKTVRPDGTVFEFPLQGIPASTYQRIMLETRNMEIPVEEVAPVDKRGNPVQGKAPEQVLLDQDPAYLANVEEMRNKRVTLIVDAALVFDIPGATWEEKFDWLQERLPGDVLNLYNTIERFLFSLPEKYGEFL